MSNNRYTHSNFPIYYIADLKAVDYRLVYQSKINKDEFNTGGLESKYENNNAKDGNLHQLIKISYTYKDFLQGALSKFRHNKFKEALYDFRTILKQFPEDMNAYFYGGLCYYNIGKYSNAVENFDFIINRYISSFDEEAEWYKARALINMGSINKANNLLKSIIKKNGFYSDRAKKLLVNK